MADYKLYFLDSENKIFERRDHQFADDLSALDKAYELANAHAVEVWTGSRRIALVKKDLAPLDALDATSL